MTVDNSLAQRELFGGAVSMALPARFADVSDFRPVPDHQEVFADGHLDQSLVVEILEHQNVADVNAAQHFFEDQAENNEARDSRLESVSFLGAEDVPGVPADTFTQMAVGMQLVAKGRQAGADQHNQVQVMLAVIRLPAQGSDVVVTLNTPAYIAPASAAAEHAGAGPKGAPLAAPELFQRMLRTFRIHDWSLFGPGPSAQPGAAAPRDAADRAASAPADMAVG